jgi:hypothetical protein
VKQLGKFAFVVLIVLNGFLALTAFLGGAALVAGINVPSAEMLGSSIFRGYVIPGLSLFVFVGGGAALAAALLIRKSRFALLASTAAGVIIMFFEFVEVLVIGSPPGVARTLQIFYYGLGTVSVILSLAVWFVDLLPGSEALPD